MARPLKRLLDSGRVRGPHVTAVLVTGMIAAVVGVIGEASHLLPGVQADTVALRFQARDSHRPNDVAVVAIDDVTFSDLDRQWPFPRALHAQAIDRLRRAGARTIVYDVQFTEPTNERDDNALYDAVARAGDVVLATTETDANGADERPRRRREPARRARRRRGEQPAHRRRRRRFERFTHSELGDLTTFALAAVRARGAGPKLEPSAFENGGAWIDYRGGPGTIPHCVVLRPRPRQGAGARAPRQDRRGRRDRAVAAGRARDADRRRRADVRGPRSRPTRSGRRCAACRCTSAPAWFDLLADRAARARAGRSLACASAPLAIVLAAPAARRSRRSASPSSPSSAGRVVAVVAPLPRSRRHRRARSPPATWRAPERRRVAELQRACSSAACASAPRELRETQLEIVRRLAPGRRVARRGHGRPHRADRAACASGSPAQIGWSIEDAELLRHAARAARRRQDRHPRPRPAQAGPARPRGARGHAAPRRRSAPRCSPARRPPLLQLAEAIARTHHERWDGGGYPAGLAGEEIPLAGRICAVCDVFDALVSPRPYKDAWPLGRRPGRDRRAQRPALRPRAGRGLPRALAGRCPPGPRRRAGLRRGTLSPPAATG